MRNDGSLRLRLSCSYHNSAIIKREAIPGRGKPFVKSVPNSGVVYAVTLRNLCRKGATLSVKLTGTLIGFYGSFQFLNPHPQALEVLHRSSLNSQKILLQLFHGGMPIKPSHTFLKHVFVHGNSGFCIALNIS